MTTAIHDIIDFIRIIREQPEWADAARSVLLSQELLELPQRFAEYAAATDQRLERLATTLADFMATANQRLERLETTLADFMATANQRLERLETTLADFMATANQRLERLETTLADFMATTNQRLERLETTLADFMATTNQRLERLETTLADFMATTNQRLERLETTLADFMATTNQRLERLETTLADFMATTNQRLAALEAGQDELKAIVTMHGAKLDQHGAKLDQLEAGQNEIRRSIGPLRGFLALNAGLRATRRIARIMNCRQVSLLNDDDLHDMLRANDTDDIPLSEQISFENADIVIVAEHRDTGDTHYITVEASFTAHTDDTRRAIRNAGYLSRFTGRPVHAVVVAVFASPEVREIFASGQAHWYEIERRYLAPD